MNPQRLVQQALSSIEKVQSSGQLSELRVKYLGRKAELTQMLREVGQLPPKDRAKSGAAANQAKTQIEQALILAEQKLRDLDLAAAAEQPIDVTVPAASGLGHLHPVTQVMSELVHIFWQMGYEVVEGPEVESEWYNFEALNIHSDHPARDMQDTFYLEKGNLPRTHTSNVQIRYMESHQPPIRIVAPGKVYRNEDEDASHSWSFYQLEGLVVDREVSLADLKGTLLAMMRGLLGEGTEIRLRPSYFPYTEPSVELDATCLICGGQGCRTCGQTGWLELGGAGMVHPQVLCNVNIDPEEFSGFAFGFGPERIAALKFGVPDIREFWRPNLNFLEQF